MTDKKIDPIFNDKDTLFIIESPKNSCQPPRLHYLTKRKGNVFNIQDIWTETFDALVKRKPRHFAVLTDSKGTRRLLNKKLLSAYQRSPDNMRVYLVWPTHKTFVDMSKKNFQLQMAKQAFMVRPAKVRAHPASKAAHVLAK